MLGPGAICRLDDALVARVREGRDLLGVARACALTIALGAGAYGAAFGLWRAPVMAAYVALKLPLLFMALAALTTGTSALLATLLRARLSLAQTSICILLALAVTAALLGALAPISALVVAVSPPPDPHVVGLAIDDRAALPTMGVARALLLWHVIVIALAGVAGVLRLRGLLAQLAPDAAAARRVLVSWLVLMLAVGAELSWLMRPFFGKPHLPPSFLRAEALRGNFFEEMGTLARAAFGREAPVVGTLAVVALGAWLLWALRGGPEHVDIDLAPAGIVSSGRIVAWASVVSVCRVGRAVEIEIEADTTLSRALWRVRCVDANAAQATVQRIEEERTRVRAGPFRTAATG